MVKIQDLIPCGHYGVVMGILIGFLGMTQGSSAQDAEAPVGMVIHGGAGTILKSEMTSEQEEQYRTKLREALETGYAVLREGGSSLDAIVATIQVMENSSLFNAGKGAVFTSEGTAELDASIMEGRTHNAGAVAGVKHVKNPILAARLVMEQSPHVMLSREGADTFAEQQGLETVSNDYFYTERRRQQLERAQQREAPTGDAQPTDEADPAPYVYGTVGAAALDRDGNLAAATSTGGMTNKRFGRIGDSPIIGAGTYADNATCAISATGHGEYFIRGVITHDISAMMRYAGLSLTEATNAVIHGKLTEMGGTGGVIAIDKDGNIAMPFNTPGMYRGSVDTDGTIEVKIYRE